MSLKNTIMDRIKKVIKNTISLYAYQIYLQIWQAVKGQSPPEKYILWYHKIMYNMHRITSKYLLVILQQCLFQHTQQCQTLGSNLEVLYPFLLCQKCSPLSFLLFIKCCKLVTWTKINIQLHYNRPLPQSLSMTSSKFVH